MGIGTSWHQTTKNVQCTGAACYSSIWELCRQSAQSGCEAVASAAYALLVVCHGWLTYDSYSFFYLYFILISCLLHELQDLSDCCHVHLAQLPCMLQNHDPN